LCWYARFGCPRGERKMERRETNPSCLQGLPPSLSISACKRRRCPSSSPPPGVCNVPPYWLITRWHLRCFGK
jgi:hypothetical protein